MPTGEGQSRKRRGPQAKRGHGVEEQPTPPSAPKRSAATLASEHLAAAKANLGDGLTKLEENKRQALLDGFTSAALQLGQLEVHLDALQALEQSGSLTADERRALPGLSRELRALRAELGLGAPRGKDGAFDFNKLTEDENL